MMSTKKKKKYESAKKRENVTKCTSIPIYILLTFLWASKMDKITNTANKMKFDKQNINHSQILY